MKVIDKSYKQKLIDERIMGFVLLIALFLPQTSIVMQAINPFLCVILALRFKSYVSGNIKFAKFLFLFALFVSCLINIVITDVSAKALLSFANIFLLIFCFPFTGGNKIRNGYLYFSICFIIVSQFALFIDFPVISNIFDKLYPVPANYDGLYDYIKNNASLGNFLSFRMGGLYRNPNQCARYVTIITSVFLLENKPKKVKQWLPFIILAGLSVLMTGSRTGFIVFGLIVLIAVFTNAYSTKGQKTGIVVILLLAFIFLLIRNVDLRGLDIYEGIGNSLVVKFEALSYYLNGSPNVCQLLFGNLDSSKFEAGLGILGMLDSEYGYLIFDFGCIGFFMYILFFLSIYKSLSKPNKPFFIIFLWIISSTILMAYRPSFLVMFLLSKYYVDSVRSINYEIA